MLAGQFEWLSPADVAPYLVQKPDLDLYPPLPDETWWQEWKRLDVPVRLGDEFTRFDECAVLDFLRLLRVRVELRQERIWPDKEMTRGIVTFLAPEFQRFWMKVDRKEERRRRRARDGRTL